jgi:hypothetical protein
MSTIRVSSSWAVAVTRMLPAGNSFPRLGSILALRSIARSSAPSWLEIPVHPPNRGRQGFQYETAPVLTLIGYDIAGMLSRDKLSTCVAQGGSRTVPH